MSIWPDFKVPTSWQVLETRELVECMKAGGTPRRKESRYWNGDIPFVLIEDMTSGKLYLDDTRERVTKDGVNESSTWIVQPGAVLLSMYATIGATVINRIPVATNQAILALIPRENISAEFLAFCLRAHKDALSARNVQATQKNISKGITEAFPLPVPPLPEQRKIAAVLGAVQRAIEQQERLLKLTAELKKTLLHQLFTQGLRREPQKQTEIGLVPESWEVAELQNLCELIVDCPHTTPKFQPSGVRVVRNFNIRNSQFVDEPAFFTTDEAYQRRTARAIPQSGDILFSREAPVGEACLVPDDVKLSLGQRTMLLRPKTTELDATFMVYNFYSANVRSRMFATASGLTVPHLNVSDVRGLLIPVPPISEQQEIARSVKAVDERISILMKKRRTLTDLFHTLLHQLMTAQLRVHEIDVEGV